ncbi:hypothetical protein NQ318_016583, partial [Aromia moschata]
MYLRDTKGEFVCFVSSIFNTYKFLPDYLVFTPCNVLHFFYLSYLHHPCKI